ncbi:MAG: hypothetical protein RJA57_1758 [Bacteroidota bacterium]
MEPRSRQGGQKVRKGKPCMRGEQNKRGYPYLAPIIVAFRKTTAMKWLKGLGIGTLVLIVAYLLGPRPAHPRYEAALPDVPVKADSLERYIADNEARHRIKPDNEARILWYNDTLKQPTEYAVVYLHGFSASQEEGDPVHYRFAQSFGCNLYLSRLDAHGIDTTDPLASFSADGVWRSAKEAYAIGKRLGKKVILMSTSTGGTLALKLAAEYPEIAALILLSPNIAINDPSAWMLNNPWGLQLAQLMVGRHRTVPDTTALYARYWNNRYATRSLVQLQELLETTMKESTFRAVTQPVLLLYYYRDEAHQDNVVKVSAMQRMFRQLGTVPALKQERALAGPGDHVIGSYVKSKDLPSVIEACEQFAATILKMQRH